MGVHDRSWHSASTPRRARTRAHRVAAAGLAVGMSVAWMDGALGTASADGATRTCRGLEATIVGSGSRIRGTSGDDVVITNGSRVVTTGAGDDTICVTPAPSSRRPETVGIFPGGGDDVVDSTAMPGDGASRVSMDLGEGSDIAVGGPAYEHVETCRGAVPDIVSTAAGNDWVGVCAKRSPDAIDTGEGDDTLLVRDPQGVRGPLVAGTGANTLVLVGPDLFPAETWVVDLAARSSTLNGDRTFGWDNASELIVVDPAAPLTVLGTDARDFVAVHSFFVEAPPSSLTVDLLGGDDRLWLDGDALGPGSRVDTGTGRDLLRAGSLGPLDIDLHEQVITGGLGDTLTALMGVEDIRAQAQRLRITGDHLDNAVRADGCDVVVRGRDGADQIRLEGYPRRALGCTRGPQRAEGGLGDDRLLGGPAHDALIGGPGRDRADGGDGVDVCAAERRVRCERWSKGE